MITILFCVTLAQHVYTNVNPQTGARELYHVHVSDPPKVVPAPLPASELAGLRANQYVALPPEWMLGPTITIGRTDPNWPLPPLQFPRHVDNRWDIPIIHYHSPYGTGILSLPHPVPITRGSGRRR